MNGKKWDFSGYATKHNLLCDDGVVITKDAFKVEDGMKVPLVYNHEHKDINGILGHAILENRNDGIYAYCSLNPDTENGRNAKAMVEHGDIESLSICATDIQKMGNQVVHGNIREVSLVIAGANPGARIESTLGHGIELDEADDEAILYTGEPLTLYHSSGSSLEHAFDGNKKVEEVLATLNEEQRQAVAITWAMLAGKPDILEQSILDDVTEEQWEAVCNMMNGEEFSQDIIDSISDEQLEAIKDEVDSLDSEEDTDGLEGESESEEQNSSDSDTIEHSAKGTVWKHHKYIKKQEGRYFYPKTDGSSQTGTSKDLRPSAKQAEIFKSEIPDASKVLSWIRLGGPGRPGDRSEVLVTYEDKNGKKRTTKLSGHPEAFLGEEDDIGDKDKTNTGKGTMGGRSAKEGKSSSGNTDVNPSSSRTDRKSSDDSGKAGSAKQIDTSTARSVLEREGLDVGEILDIEVKESSRVMKGAPLGTVWVTYNDSKGGRHMQRLPIDNFLKGIGKVKHSAINEGGSKMLHNAFETYGYGTGSARVMGLSAEDKKTLMHDAMSMGHFNTAVIEHMKEGGVLYHAVPTEGMETPSGTQPSYGIFDLAMLTPDYREVFNGMPQFLSRDMIWVQKFLGKVHRTPFKKIRTTFADITEEEARAKGYIKGNQKKDEVFALLKRTTDPQTIYKKQKLDRDDMADIDFDVVPWLSSEMDMMLDEEEARAALIGDNRLADAEDKIKEDRIRPIAKDVSLFNTVVKVTVPAGATDAEIAEILTDAIVAGIGDHYKGSGNPTLWTTNHYATRMLLQKDKVGHRLYKTREELSTGLLVDEVVAVEPMEGTTIKIESKSYPLIGVVVNPVDYNIGGGQLDKDKKVTEGFDIDYNQHKYLKERRVSGAMVKPFASVTFVLDQEAAARSVSKQA